MENVNIPVGYVCIEKKEYDSLIKSDIEFGYLLEELREVIENASLAWDREKLHFDMWDVEPIIKRYMPINYTLKVKEEQAKLEQAKEKIEKEATKDAE